MSYFSIDFETRSMQDVKKVGGWRYADDPSTEIVLCAIAYGDGPVHTWDKYADPEDNLDALELIWQCSRSKDEVWAFNATGFEVPVSLAYWQSTFNCPPPTLHRWRCSAVLCRVAAIPASLDRAAEFLKLNVQKDKMGMMLIRLFCSPRTSKALGEHWVTPRTDWKITINSGKMLPADAWVLFREYCRKDVEVERQLHKRLAKLELTGDILKAFQIDLEMCVRGIPINLVGVRNAINIVDDYTAGIALKFRELTGISHTQGAKFMVWLRARGYKGPDLRAGTVKDALELENDGDDPEIDPAGLHPDAVAALKMKTLVSYAATKKLVTMERTVCRDGAVRGALMFYGAHTGRSSGKLIQIQNFKRSVLGVDSKGVPLTHQVAEAITAGTVNKEDIQMIWGEPLSVIASSIRHFIDPGPDKYFLDIDLAQIEARVLAWVAGDEELLQTFRDGKDLYKTNGVGMFGVEYDKVSKDQRQLSKIACLSLGYGGGKGAFTVMSANYGMKLGRKAIKEIVRLYREANPKIKALWGSLSKVVTAAVKRPGEWHEVNSLVKVAVTQNLGYPCLIIKLPSGRNLYYPKPEVRTVYKRKYPDPQSSIIRLDEDCNELDPEDEEEIKEGWYDIPDYTAFNPDGTLRDGVWATEQISYHANIIGVNWGQCDTWGGSLTENVCQAIAADFLNYGIANLESAGYRASFSVHDQVLVHYEPEKGQNLEEMVELFTKVPEWAGNFPLGAEADITPYYTKL